MDSDTGFLITIVCFLILLSGFFSSAETGMMSLNRYRLRHLVKKKHRPAQKADDLLRRPDRLIGVILIGNNFVNILAASITTIIAISLWPDSNYALTATNIVLTLIILIFAEVTPKTIASLHPERIAFPAAYVLDILLKILYPLVWIVNTITNNILRPMGINPSSHKIDHLSEEELRTVVDEAGMFIQPKRQNMLLRILDLEKVTVNDIMVPRHEIIGIDIHDNMNEIVQYVRSTQHTRLPVYKEDINQVIGILHMRNAARFFSEEKLSKSALIQQTAEPYFVPESTPLHIQLVNFQKRKERIALVVNEYGDIEGIVTLEDILEEIVGEFTTDLAASSKDIHPQNDGTYFIDGGANIRDINRALQWTLPTDGAKTLNGLITEALQSIPIPHSCIQIADYYVEILQTKDNTIKTARLWPSDQLSRKTTIDS